MRWMFAAIAATLLGSATPALPQSGGLEVELTLDETVFLPGEEIPVGVRVSNLSGRPVTLGTTTNWLMFFVEAKNGGIVYRLGQTPVDGEFTLESSKAGTKWWNIQPYFDFEQAGLYSVYAEVRVPDWDQRFLSDPITFTLQSARKMWETSFGVPPAPGDTNSTPEIRRYALQSASRTKERKLYARVTDESETHIYKVVLLDRLLSFSNPTQQLDPLSRLHVLFQTSGNSYTYCVLDPNGDIVVRERHEITPGSRPRLSKAPDGSITVAGGRRQPSLSDIPPYVPPPPASLDSTNAPAPATNQVQAAPASEEKTSRAEKRRKRREERSATPSP